MEFLEQSFGLKGKTAVVTGGAGTLCGAIAEGYLKAGAKVVLWGRNNDNLVNRKKELIKKEYDPESIITIEVDLMEEDNVVKALDETLKIVNNVDILVNGVGGSSHRCPLTEVDIKDFEKIMNLNLLAGCITPTKHIAAYWIKEKIKGSVINIASMASYNPLSGGWAYSAAKAAVSNQTMALACELAEYGVRVNAIAPGFFLGKQNKRLLMNEDRTPTERGKNVLVHTPMNRFGQPEELIGIAVFLASNSASFVSGTTIPVDGAFLCHNI